jgi:transposase
MNFIGIDVSKQKLDCSLIRSNLPDKPLHKTVPNTQEGVTALLDWAQKKAGCDISELHAILEATGPYHEVAAETLFNAGSKVSVVNPAYTKNFAKSLGLKTKNDRADATVLAKYGLKMHAELGIWQPPPPHYRQLRSLLGRKKALETDVQRERNRLEKYQAAAHTEAFVSASVERSIKHMETELELLEQAIETHIQVNPELAHNRELLYSVKGVGDVLSSLLLPVLQPGRFDSAPQVAAYLGLVPVEHQSGSSVNGRPHLSKAGDSTLRSKLYMPMLSAIRYNPDIKALYERLLAKGKSKKCAVCACMRKLVHICFGVLKHQTTYSPKVA